MLRPNPLQPACVSLQVYKGDRPWWTEADATDPVNQYGRTKLEAEQYLQANYPPSIALRSSIIYGPAGPLNSSRELFI